MMNKNIKRILAKLVVIFLISCNLSTTKDSNFTGNWKLIKHNGVHFNVLPDIKLNEISRKLDVKLSKEHPMLPDNKVIFSYDSTNYFSETEFYYRVLYENENEYLELISFEENNRYLLSRE